MDKREFFMQYILNRARGYAGEYFLNVSDVADESLASWKKIEDECPQAQPMHEELDGEIKK